MMMESPLLKISLILGVTSLHNYSEIKKMGGCVTWKGVQSFWFLAVFCKSVNKEVTVHCLLLHWSAYRHKTLCSLA